MADTDLYRVKFYIGYDFKIYASLQPDELGISLCWSSSQLHFVESKRSFYIGKVKVKHRTTTTKLYLVLDGKHNEKNIPKRSVHADKLLYHYRREISKYS